MSENVLLFFKYVLIKVTHQSKQHSISIINLPYGKDWISFIDIENKQTQATNQTPRPLQCQLSWKSRLHCRIADYIDLVLQSII